MSNSPFMLTESERLSPLWARLVEHMGAQIAALHTDLEKPGGGKDDFLRGQIYALRKLIAKGKEDEPAT